MRADITVQGIRYHYEVTGDGADVVLLHGWGCTLEIWQSLRSVLEPDFRVWAIDFPGFGGSATPPDPWSVYDYAESFAAFLQQLGITDPVLVGHSFGGRIAILHASSHPVSKVVLVDAAGIRPRRSVNYYVKVYGFKLMKRLLPFVLGKERAAAVVERRRRSAGSDDYNALSGVMRDTFVRVVNEDLRRYLPAIEAPTLLVWGDRDTATPLADAKLMERRIADAGLVVFPGAGHYSFLERSGQFAAVMRSFLSDNKPQQ